MRLHCWSFSLFPLKNAYHHRLKLLLFLSKILLTTICHIFACSFNLFFPRMKMLRSKTFRILPSAPLFGLWCLILMRPLCDASGITCYAPDQTVAEDDIPCDPTQKQSFCCGKGWACLENKSCVPTELVPNGGTLSPARGTCTDKSWQSSSCPDFCVSKDGMYPTRGLVMQKLISR